MKLKGLDIVLKNNKYNTVSCKNSRAINSQIFSKEDTIVEKLAMPLQKIVTHSKALSMLGLFAVQKNYAEIYNI